MKKILYITLLLVIISCSKAKREAPLMDSEATEMSQEAFPIENIALEESFTFQQLTQQKLQEYYDLLVLLKQHPEFKEDIILQLEELSKIQITITDFKQPIRIENVQQLGESEQISDSIQKINIQFDIVNDSSFKKDSITVIIKTHKMIFEDKEVSSTKVQFLKE